MQLLSATRQDSDEFIFQRDCAQDTLMQARREPQRGPGNRSHGALYITTSVCAEIKTPKTSRGRKRGEGCPLTIRVGVWGRLRRSPSGVRVEAPAENGFYAYLRSERSHLGNPFQYFWTMAGPPKRRGPWKTFPIPLSTGLDTL